MSILLSQSSHPPLTPPCPHVHSLSLHLYFCLENKFNLTRHGDSSIGRNEVKLQMKKNPKNHKELRFKDSTRWESKKQSEGKDTAISGKVRKESFVGYILKKTRSILQWRDPWWPVCTVSWGWPGLKDFWDSKVEKVVKKCRDSKKKKSDNS